MDEGCQEALMVRNAGSSGKVYFKWLKKNRF